MSRAPYTRGLSTSSYLSPRPALSIYAFLCHLLNLRLFSRPFCAYNSSKLASFPSHFGAAIMCPTGSSLLQATAVRLEFRPAFDVLDTDRDGKISREDLRSFCSGFNCGVAGDEEVIGSMISMADTNKDGFVEYDEFERVLDCRKSPRNEGRGVAGVMEDVFKVMDRDGDGKVGLEDLKSYMSWAGFSATEDDIKAMIRLGGGDESSGVSYDGLLKILAVDYD